MRTRLALRTTIANSLAARLPQWTILVIGVALVSLVAGQSKPPMRGTVVTTEGKPIAGVTVHSGSQETTTDGAGRFRLESPGAVVHFWKEDFRPTTLVLRPGTSSGIHIRMEPPTSSLVVPVCGIADDGVTQISWGDYGLRFSVPTRSVKVTRREQDVDYVLYLIKPETGDGLLELWFGPLAFSLEPQDDLFVSSLDFAQRHVVTSKGELTGMDSWGRLRTGKSWRQTAIIGEGGAIYRNASPEDASLFDEIINSTCVVPYP